jgi:Leucine-rich repeat (LRR) protein
MELGSLASLTELSLYDNSLSGSLPSELGSLTSLMAALYLYSNQLTGQDPYMELGSLASLTELSLDGNILFREASHQSLEV